jgi:hypothetical protein
MAPVSSARWIRSPLGERGQDDHRRDLRGGDLGRRLDAVLAGHLDVHDHQAWERAAASSCSPLGDQQRSAGGRRDGGGAGRAGVVGWAGRVPLVADRRCRNDELLMRRGLGVVGLIATAPAARRRVLVLMGRRLDPLCTACSYSARTWAGGPRSGGHAPTPRRAPERGDLPTPGWNGRLPLPGASGYAGPPAALTCPDPAGPLGRPLRRVG